MLPKVKVATTKQNKGCDLAKPTAVRSRTVQASPPLCSKRSRLYVYEELPFRRPLLLLLARLVCASPRLSNFSQGGGGRRQPRLSSCRLGRVGADRRSAVPHHAEAYLSREGGAAGHRATSGGCGGVCLAWCRRSRRRNAWGQANVSRRSTDRLLLLAILRKRMRPGTASRQTHVLTSRRRAAHRRKHLKSH